MKNKPWPMLAFGLLAGTCAASLTYCQAQKGTEPNPSTFVEGTVIGIAKDHPKQHNVVFINTTDPDTVKTWPPNRWNVVDCSRIVPDGTKAVALSSLLIITHGKNAGIANLTVAVRRHGSTIDNSRNYHTQTVEAHTGGGQRTSDTIWVALSPDRRFEVFWSRSDEPPYPDGSAYGVNMNLFGYLR
jgi:hypothetical protein